MDNLLLKIGCAYIRVSDERQDEYSPDSQLRIIREYASREGYQIPDEYVFYDDGISGRSTKNRNDFNRMISIAKDKDKAFDVIYVWKFSRFARNQEESLVYKNLLKKLGVTVKSVSETIPDGIYGSLIERIIEWMDEFYSVNLGTEVKRGFAEKFARGEPTFNAPFGYIIKDKKFFPATDGSAEIVKLVFERFLNGNNVRQIAVDLGNQGIKTSQGKSPDNRWVEYMLTNPIYIGKLRRSADGTRAISKRKQLDNELIEITDGIHEPIISQELWDKVQAKLKAFKLAYPKHARCDQKIQYMLKGIVRCSNCNATLIVGAIYDKQGHRTLQCHNYNRGICKVPHGIAMHKMESAIIEALEECITKADFNIEPSTITSTKPTVNFEQLIAIENKKLARAKTAYLNEIDTLEQYKQNKADIEARITELTNLWRKENKTEINPVKFAKKVLKVLEYIKKPNATAQSKNEALRSILSKVIYDKPNNNLALFFHL